MITGTLVAALAGRRIDADGMEKSSFPISSIDAVRHRLRHFFNKEKVGTLVSSAACGADLLALDEAGKCGLHRLIILPFPPKWFRLQSVVDRHPCWGELFDQIVGEVATAGDLIVLDLPASCKDPYATTNERILAYAQSLSGGRAPQPIAVTVWDGVARESGDYTEHFRRLAVDRGFTTHFIPTL